MENSNKGIQLAKAEWTEASIFGGPFGSDMGNYAYTPNGSIMSGGAGSAMDRYWQNVGLTPNKISVLRDYPSIIQMCYDFYQRGGLVGTVVDRLAEFSITEIRNGQRKTTDEGNEYFSAVLHERPSRLMRLLHNLALEYFLSGMVLPRVDWVKIQGKDINPRMKPGKWYSMPVFDWYPPSLVDIQWVGWGKKSFFLKIPSSDIKLIKNNGSKIKEQQIRYDLLTKNYPDWVGLIKNGESKIELTDVDPILRKEVSTTPYPTPYLYKVLEALVYKQQLRRMDYSVASRVINAILLVREGNNEYPLTAENQDNLDALKTQILARSNNPSMMERLFMLFTNHTTQLNWITPDTAAMLNQEKYVEVNNDIEEGLGFTRVLVTGASRSSGGGSASEVSTWAIQPSMEELRSSLIEWVSKVYEVGADLNGFRNLPIPAFKPIRLQDFIKTAAIFAQVYKEGIISRTTRAESVGQDYETETELMHDEAEYSKDLPAFPPTPYSPPPPLIGSKPSAGRPMGSQDVPINNRNSGIKPSGQEPTSQLRAEDLMNDEDLVEALIAFAERRGITITPEIVKNTPPLMNE